MSPFLGCQCWYSFDDKTLFPAAKAVLTHCVHADLFFVCLETLKECMPDLFNVLCSNKI